MTLRSRLLLLLFALFIGLGVTQWVLLRSLTRELHDEAGAAAFEVGNSVASALGYSVPEGSTPETIPFSKILPQEEALILSTTDTEGGDVAVELRLGARKEPGEASPNSTPMIALQPALSVSEKVEREIPIPRDGFDAAFERHATSQTLGFLLLSALGLIAAGWMAWSVSAPLRGLSEAARRLGEGELGLQIPEAGSSEIAGTARAFNHMSRELQSYERLARQHREREHLSEIGELASALAHSLRNPLNALGLTLEEHERALEASGETWPEATSARGQIRRIEGALRSLLAITGAESSHSEEVRLGHLARDVALEVTQDSGNGLEIDVDDASGERELLAVSAELRAVLHTLLVNAAEASPPGGRIEVSIAGGEDDEVVLEVVDRGRGLAQEIEGGLFEPHATTKARGTGMGLFLARRIVDSRYGGSLELSPREGGGVCARLVLRSRVEESRG